MPKALRGVPGPWTGWPADGEPPVVIGREEAREEAERELSKEIYAQHEPGLAERALDALFDFFDSLLDGLSGSVPGGGWSLLLIGLLVTGLLVALRLRLGALRTAASARTGTALLGGPRSAADHRAAADRHAAAGRWADAVTDRMRALVRSLEERDLLSASPGRTADEAADEAGSALPAHAERLRDAARTFDAVAYGGAPAGAEDHARLHALDEELRRTRPTPAATGGAAR